MKNVPLEDVSSTQYKHEMHRSRLPTTTGFEPTPSKSSYLCRRRSTMSWKNRVLGINRRIYCFDIRRGFFDSIVEIVFCLFGIISDWTHVNQLPFQLRHSRFKSKKVFLRIQRVVLDPVPDKKPVSVSNSGTTSWIKNYGNETLRNERKKVPR